ncbi:unnamed protein product [Paramecium primaurelia]|uniref:Transmembrane protein n=1 Tax=Paramecium primaurelia TaxID=5886 RepID=A0A8S1QE61_PARPR|nr:unnamed protein product [Paramecium primaurelia]
MQYSSDPHYFEMSNYPNNVYQIDPMMNPIVPQANLPTQINSPKGSDPDSQISTRKSFLFQYYVKQIIQLIGITLIYGINQIGSFSSIYLSEVDREWWGSSYTYEKFLKYYSYDATRQDYLNWMEERRREFMDYEFNWVYYFILALTVFFTLFVAFARNYRCLAQKQSIGLLIQTVLIGFVVGGISSGYRQNWQHQGTVFYILFSLIGLIVNAIFNLVLIKINKIQIYGKLSKIFTYFFFGFNFLIAFREYYRVEGLPILEFVVLYSFFYFDHLNKSLLIQPSELPSTINILDLLSNIQTELNSNQFKPNQNFILINKKILLIVSIGFGLVLLELFGYLISTFVFIIITIISVLTIISFVVPTQVAQQTLEIEDASIAVMMTYLDMLCPIQNIIRHRKI